MGYETEYEIQNLKEDVRYLKTQVRELYKLVGKTEVMGLPLREAREIFEREYLMSQVSRFGGNISRTANFVGMERAALHRKLKSLGISRKKQTKQAGQ